MDSDGARAFGVSVLICSRNGFSRGFLVEAIESVRRQTTPAHEVVLVDDGSTDQTADEIEERFPDVRVLRQPPAGLATARNRGIAAATGRWIAFLDDDDVWHAEKLERQVAQARATGDHGSMLFCARIADIVADGAIQSYAMPIHLASWPACLLGWPAIAPSGTLISRELLERIGPFDETLAYGSAYQYWVRCLAAGIRPQFSDIVLMYRRLHPGQMTRDSQLLANALISDDIVAPFVRDVAPSLAKRIAWARILLAIRGLLRRGARSAVKDYWRNTPFKSYRWSSSALGMVLLDSAANLSPQKHRAALRAAVVRSLRR